MYQKEITDREAGQRLDKYLHRLLPEAGSSFLYKMLRKKNITLNGKKADGSEKITAGDMVTVFFAAETLARFMGEPEPARTAYDEAYEKLTGITILYEDEHILLADKPAGILSQKADKTDLSLNEWLIGHLLHSKAITQEETFRLQPSGPQYKRHRALCQIPCRCTNAWGTAARQDPSEILSALCEGSGDREPADRGVSAKRREAQ